MPVIKSAKKKLRQDRKREKINDLLRKDLSSAVKNAKKTKTAEKIRLANQKLDKAVKKSLIHKNKAARIKSSLSKLVKNKPTKKVAPSKSPKKKVASKSSK